MDRYQIIRIIHDYMSKKPVLKAWIFGSFARGEERAQSEYAPCFGAWLFAGVTSYSLGNSKGEYS